MTKADKEKKRSRIAIVVLIAILLCVVLNCFLFLRIGKRRRFIYDNKLVSDFFVILFMCDYRSESHGERVSYMNELCLTLADRTVIEDSEFNKMRLQKKLNSALGGHYIAAGDRRIGMNALITNDDGKRKTMYVKVNEYGVIHKSDDVVYSGEDYMPILRGADWYVAILSKDYFRNNFE